MVDLALITTSVSMVVFPSFLFSVPGFATVFLEAVVCVSVNVVAAGVISMIGETVAVGICVIVEALGKKR